MVDEIVVRDHTLDHALPRWAKWSTRSAQGSRPQDLGFHCERATLNRVNARFRTAKSFRGVLFADFRDDTASGYSGLFKLLLTWSAFEQYYQALGLSASTRDSLLTPHLPHDPDSTIRGLDPGNQFFALVAKSTRADVRQNIEAYLSHRRYRLTYLPCGIRHAFAHGILTPHGNNADASMVAHLCHYLSNVLLKCMATDFTDRMRNLA